MTGHVTSYRSSYGPEIIFSLRGVRSMLLVVTEICDDLQGVSCFDGGHHLDTRCDSVTKSTNKRNVSTSVGSSLNSFFFFSGRYKVYVPERRISY